LAPGAGGTGARQAGPAVAPGAGDAGVELLAERPRWDPLCDLDVLAANEVPVVAAVYYDDMYIDAGLQMETASRIGNTHTWVTNEYEHDGIRSDRVYAHLTELLDATGLRKQ
jgi:hypothetical protein